MKNLVLLENQDGRDFIVGDIHGQFGLLRHALDCVAFDASLDRIISVGDLIDRGPQNEDVLEWIDWKPFYAVQGNHEFMLPECLQDCKETLADPSVTPEIYREFLRINQFIRRNGQTWFYELCQRDMRKAEAICRTLSDLPHAITITDKDGNNKYGIVHADPGYDWNQLLSNNTLKHIERALWSRDNTPNRDENQNPILTEFEAINVANIERVFVGHTVFRNSFKHGNVHYLDTGAHCKDGSLTLFDLKNDKALSFTAENEVEFNLSL